MLFLILAPLLSAQHYVQGVAQWQGEPIAKDFVALRHLMVPDVDLATQHWRCVTNIEPDVTTPWLIVPDAVRHGRPVFARSTRYRNRHWDAAWDDLKASNPRALFVGTEAEFVEFGHGEHYLARSALDLAQVISGASIFVGNQSLPYAIAEGLKVPRLLEVSPLVPNCTIPVRWPCAWLVAAQCQSTDRHRPLRVEQIPHPARHPHATLDAVTGRRQASRLCGRPSE